MELILALVSVFLGNLIGNISAKLATYQVGINLFSIDRISEVPHFSPEIANLKTQDTLSFIFTIGFTAIIFLFFKYVVPKIQNINQKLITAASFIIPALTFMIFTTFTGFSILAICISITAIYVSVILLTYYIPKDLPKSHHSEIICNGIITGIFLMLFIKNLFPIPALSTTLLLLSPIYFYAFSVKIKFFKNPAISLLAFSVFYPFNLTGLLIILGAVILLVTITQARLNDYLIVRFQKLLPYITLFVLLYNPLYYLGNFDPVEEGFWAGWLQRLLDNKVPYRDFAAHHPPLLLAGLNIFTKIFGASLLNIRLFFHLLQIVGLIIIYKVIENTTNSRLLVIGIFVLILIFSAVQVRNNMEIRIGLGLLPILVAFLAKRKNSLKLKITTGILVGVALMTSLETGLSSLIATMSVLVLDTKLKNVMKNIGFYFSGLILITTFLIVYLLMNGSLSKFVEYMTFYPSTFASGFQNLPLSTPSFSPMLEWRNMYSFVDSPGFIWYLSLSLILTAILMAVSGTIKKKADTDLVLGLGIFGLIASRSALARSDYYHISYIFIVAIILLGWLLLQFKNYKYALVSILLAAMLFVKRDSFSSFAESQLIKLQSYGTPPGSYPKYEGERAKIYGWIDFDSKNFNALISFLSVNTVKADKIFVLPQAPEIYFLTDRQNASEFDTPTNFYSKHYQSQMIENLISSNPKYIVYSDKLTSGGVGAKDLRIIDDYVKSHYKTVEIFGLYSVLTKI